MTYNSGTVTAATDATAAQYNNLRKDVLLQAGEYVTSGGSANAQTFTLDAQITAYVEGMCIPFKAGFTNTGAATGNVNGIGAKDIKLPDGSALGAGDITAGRIYEMRYDGTNLVLMSSSGTLLATGGVNTTATNATFTADAGTDVITSNGHNLQNGDKVVLTTTGTLPAGLSLTTGYFVRDRTANTFKLSTLPFRAAIDITDAGSGTHTWTNAQGSINLSFTAKKHLKIVIYAVPTASSLLRMTFNEDGTGTKYGTRQSTAGGAESANSTQDSITELAGTANASPKFCVAEVLNISGIRKHGQFSGQSDNNSAASSGSIVVGSFVYNDTSAQITKVCVNLSDAAGMGAGAVVDIYGYN